MAFEIYKPTATRADALTISLSKTGRIGFNAATTRVLSKARVKAVLLLWDAEHSIIAIRAAAKEELYSRTISFHREHSSATLSAIGFLRFINWSAQEKQTIPAKWNASGRSLEATVPTEFIEAEESTGHQKKKTPVKQRPTKPTTKA